MVILPPLHIKPGLMKNLVKALNREGEAFRYLTKKFPAISEAKLKVGILWDLKSVNYFGILSLKHYRISLREMPGHILRMRRKLFRKQESGKLQITCSNYAC